MMGYGRFYGGHGFGGYGFGLVPHILGMIVMLIVLTFLVILTVRMIKHKGSHINLKNINGNNNYGNALVILNERFAKGEIDTEEYKKIKAEITVN